MLGGSFTADITAIRERARQQMEEGPVTGSYGKDPKDVIAVLNEVLATEIVCWMRYTRHAISATGMNRAQVASEFTEHAESGAGSCDARGRADQPARRRTRLRPGHDRLLRGAHHSEVRRKTWTRKSTPDNLVDLLRRMTGRAGCQGCGDETSAVAADRAAFAAAVESGRLDLPLPGAGATRERWAAFADLAGEDLSLARLGEGHADAVAILAELGGPRPEPGSRWGVWAANPPGPNVTASQRGGRLAARGHQAVLLGGPDLHRRPGHGGR